MDALKYEHLVLGLEGSSKSDPAAFRLRVILISCLAYIILFALLTALGLLVYWLFGYARERHNTFTMVKIGLFALVLLPIFWVTLRAFFTRIRPPEGRAVTREEAPRLFEALDKIRQRLKGPPIDQVLVDDQYNAAICQVPRLGLFGWHRNYLLIGLPYLLGTPTQEALATLAHEYGHLSGEHGKMGSWIYRQRLTFSAIHQQVSDAGETDWVSGLLSGLLDRFAPYYNAYTFVLSRQQEYEADAAASRIAGEAANANGLVRDILLGRWIGEVYWRRLYDQADEHHKPRFLPFSAMRTAFAAAHAEWATADRLRAALKEDSGLHDTHPCLRERLEAMECKPALPAISERCAADSLLGSATTKALIEAFDRDWWESNRNEWQAHFQRRSEDKLRLARLSAQEPASLIAGDLHDLADLQYRLGDPQQALALVNMLSLRSDAPVAKCGLLKGRILLYLENDAGLDCLVQAMRSDARLSDDCLRAGYAYLSRREGEAAAEAWVQSIVGPDED